jgi:hypothetical protein
MGQRGGFRGCTIWFTGKWKLIIYFVLPLLCILKFKRFQVQEGKSKKIKPMTLLVAGYMFQLCCEIVKGLDYGQED